MKPTTPEETERITARYRRSFSEPGDTDIKLVRRCCYGASVCAYSLIFLTIFSFVGTYLRHTLECVLTSVGVIALTLFAFTCARRLDGVRAYLESHGA